MKPVTPESGAFGGTPSGDDEPDWLRQLRDDEPKGGQPSGSGAEPPAEVPDWLSRIRDKAGDTEKSSGLFADEPAGDADPDWMKGLQSEESASTSFGDSDDWLSRLGGEQAAPEIQAEPETPAAPSGGGENEVDLSAWLSGLDQEDASPAANVDAPQPAADDSDDWLSNLKGFDSSEPPAEQPGEQAPAWGAGLWADEQADHLPSAESQPAAEPAGAEDFDWLRSFDPGVPAGTPAETPSETPAQASTDFSDEQPQEPEQGQSSSGWGLTGWLDHESGLPEASEPALPEWGQAEEAPPAQPADASQADLPDWLSGVSAASAATQPPAPEQGDVPSWLSDDQPAPAEAQTPAEPAAESSVPSWLSGFDAGTPAAQQPPAAEPEEQPSAADSEGLPAWLRGDFGADASAPVSQPEQPAGDLPGWFSSTEETAAETPAAFSADDSAETGQPDFAFNPFAMEDEPAQGEPAIAEPVSAAEQPPVVDEQPDWLQSLQTVRDEEPAPEPRPEPARGTGPLPFVEEDLPDWMNEFKGQPATEPSTPPLIPVEEYASMPAEEEHPFNVDLPDWLAEEGAARQAQSAEMAESGQSDSEDLAQAELPSWVAAMRPVETAMQGDAGPLETDQHVERAGPLSGIRGVLPADDHVISYRKPPVYSMKLRVSEKQRGHAGLLESLLGQEVKPLVLPAVKSQAPQIMLRVLVALFLMLVLAGSLLVNLQLTPVPTFYPPEVIDLYDQVEALPADATVLLAVDYQPGLSGEMQFASAMVIDHLMGRNAQIAIVSTVPTGPAMADSLLKQVQANRPEYDLAARVANLGYLPGGTISLLEFARDPRSAAPRTTDGEDAWSLPVLAGVDEIQKFARVVVITDRAEVGRDWVEQVQPYLGDVPLLIVSSAQAAPLLEPYVESRQLQGMVSGLMGGTMYGQRSGRQAANPALGHYGAYQVGVLLAFLLVLVGAIFSALVSTVNRKQKNRE